VQGNCKEVCGKYGLVEGCLTMIMLLCQIVQDSAVAFRLTATFYACPCWLEALCIDLSMKLPRSFSTWKTPWSSTCRIVFETRHLCAHFELPGGIARLFVIQTSNRYKICTLADISIFYPSTPLLFPIYLDNGRRKPNLHKKDCLQGALSAGLIRFLRGIMIYAPFRFHIREGVFFFVRPFSEEIIFNDYLLLRPCRA